MLERLDIIIPTWNNPQFLFPCIQSILTTRLCYPLRIIVVNNGHPDSVAPIKNIPEIEIVQCKENLGWEGGLKEGLKHSNSKYVMFANDDIFIPRSSTNWLRKMMSKFGNESVGAVGPISNCVMGPQNMLSMLQCASYFVNYLIGFCILLKRDALEKCGGVDDTLPGGDDIDISIRLRQAGYNLVMDRESFVFHYGFKTGERVHGGSDKSGGWNSEEMTERTNHALIVKHGLRTWFDTLYGKPGEEAADTNDTEGMIIRNIVRDGTVLELGCGGTKTVPHSVGVDYYPKGVDIPTINQASVADISCSVENLSEGKIHQKFDYIIARHILEHVIDPLKTLRHWKEYLKPGGMLIIAVPDESICDSISMNPEHKHGFTTESLSNLFNAAGLSVGRDYNPDNRVSFILEGINNVNSTIGSVSLCGVGNENS